MIKQLEYSESVGPPRDQKTARGALRLLGGILAGANGVPVTDRERFVDEVRRELVDLEGKLKCDEHAGFRDPVMEQRIAKLRALLAEYQP